MILNFRRRILLVYISLMTVLIIGLFPIARHFVDNILRSTLESRAQKMVDALAAKTNLAEFFEEIERTKIGLYYRVSVFDRLQGTIYDTHFDATNPNNPHFSALTEPEVAEAFAEGIAQTVKRTSTDEREMMFTALRFSYQGRDYVVRTGFPFSHIHELNSRFETGFLLIAALVLLVFSLVMWVAFLRFSRPISQIIAAINPYHEGKTAALPRIDLESVNASDDFGRLATTINQLSTKIEEQIATLRSEAQERSHLLETLVEGVVAVDTRLCITYINSQAQKMLGLLPRTSILGLHFSATEEYACQNLLRQCQLQGSVLRQIVTLAKDPSSTYQVIAIPRREGGAVLVLEDQTHENKILEAKRDFISNASHELKTPITIIKGFCETLLDHPDILEAKRQAIMTKIVSNCERMDLLVKSLLSLADVERMSISKLIDTDLRQLADKSSQLARLVHPTAQIAIDAGPIHLEIDPDLMQLALENLISNAAKYSPDPAQIRIVIRDEDRFVRIAVEDRGIGIPLKDQEAVFDRFYTVDRAHSHKMGGSGLGLAIVKTIVNKHCGTISVQSHPGEGTTMTIHLPKNIAELLGAQEI